jgi:hypothetical protein
MLKRLQLAICLMVRPTLKLDASGYYQDFKNSSSG